MQPILKQTALNAPIQAVSMFKSGQPTEHAQLYRSGHTGVLKRKLRFSGFLEWPTGKRRLQEKQFWRGSVKE